MHGIAPEALPNGELMGKPLASTQSQSKRRSCVNFQVDAVTSVVGVAVTKGKKGGGWLVRRRGGIKFFVLKLGKE